MTVIATPQRARPKKKISWTSVLIQVLFVLAFFALIAYFAINAIEAISARGMTSGFGFLERPRSWAFPPSIFDTDSQDTYLKTTVVAALNTLVVGLAAIVLSTVFGFLLGIAQVGNNFLLRSLSRGFVQLCRNIPTVVYVVFLFSIALTLPAPRQALSAFDVVYLSNRGLLVPAIEATSGFWTLACLFLVVAVVAFGVLRSIRPDRSALRHAAIALFSCIGSFTALAIGHAAAGSFRISVPQLTGFNFAGGMTLSLEVTTLVAALTFFGSAYIGEIVRGGLTSVSQGLIEAATALGLKPWQVFLRVRLPVAMRSIIPAISNQYLYMMKGTSLGIVIGFADLFTVANLSINYSGQTLEILGLMMAIFVVINVTMSRMTDALNSHLQFKTNGT